VWAQNAVPWHTFNSVATKRSPDASSMTERGTSAGVSASAGGGIASIPGGSC
jgi:hypothetical protein